MNRQDRPTRRDLTGRNENDRATFRPWPWFALFLLALLALYWPSLGGAFLWDDAGHVTHPALQSSSGLLRIWFEPGSTQQYYPLLHSAFWLEHRLWGEATWGYHLVNVIWHATSATLLVMLLRRLGVPGALLAGWLFALHPVCVESVAWIAEQKNTLSTVFYLAAALAWLRFEDDRRPRRYAIASAWFLAALLTKTVTATLPASLLVLAWWRHGRVSWRTHVLPLSPWLTVGAALGLFTAWFEKVGIGAKGADFDLSFLQRGLLAGRVLWFYVSKLVWPAELAFFYPRWQVDASAAWQYVFPAAAVALIGGVVWAARRGHSRGVLAALLIFTGTLFPALGFVDVYPFVFSYVADHFQYLAAPSLFALAAAGVARVTGAAGGSAWPRALHGLTLLVLGALAFVTWRVSGHYVDSITLYRASLASNPDSWVAHHNLASELAARGHVDQALTHARRAAALRPNSAEVLNNLADNLTRSGQPTEAVGLLEQALQLQPGYAEAQSNLGVALARLGRTSEAIDRFTQAIALQPKLAEAHYNLGLALSESEKFDAAVDRFATAVRLRPDHAGAELHWGVALAMMDRLADARPHFERALTLDPGAAASHQTYGRVLLEAGELESAVTPLREAFRLDPRLPGIHGDLAFVLQRLGRWEEARAHAAMARQIE